jgi:hypothetical protein
MGWDGMGWAVERLMGGEEKKREGEGGEGAEEEE